MKTVKNMLIDHFEFYSVTPSVNQINLWADQLAGLNPDDVYEAMKKSWSDSANSKPVMPAKLIEIALGITPPNEAWACVEKINNDERAAIVWTDEIRLAWGDAYPLMRAGDMVAARMTFLESYRNRISSLIAEKKFPKYILSSGSQEDNKTALLEAVKQKKLTIQRALQYDPNLEIPKNLISGLQLGQKEILQIEHRLEKDVVQKSEIKIKEIIEDFFKKQDEKKENDRLAKETEKEEARINLEQRKNEQIENYLTRRD